MKITIISSICWIIFFASLLYVTGAFVPEREIKYPTHEYVQSSEEPAEPLIGITTSGAVGIKMVGMCMNIATGQMEICF